MKKLLTKSGRRTLLEIWITYKHDTYKNAQVIYGTLKSKPSAERTEVFNWIIMYSI